MLLILRWLVSSYSLLPMVTFIPLVAALIHEKELLAIVDSFRDMRSWLIGNGSPSHTQVA
jgi:hypothetical protein